MTGDYLEIGGILRSAREEFRLSTHDVSEALHIRAIYLEAIEDGQFERLPGAAYARGYLRAYASYLQLDPNEILRRFEQIEEKLKRGFYLPKVMRHEKKPSSSMVWGGLAAALILYALWSWLAHPRHAEVSVVDAPSTPVSVRHESFGMPNNAACFRKRDVLYPPCHKTGAQVSLQPVRRQLTTIMDLGVPKKNKISE